ncbi:MAG: hypothetical protein LBI54_05055, partial [Lachnospiraceae bacterium]|nr:hypothetical protein [Lachnospiraceae bacterium]
AEPDRYGQQIAFYDSILGTEHVIATITPVSSDGKSWLGLFDFVGSTKRAFAYLNGGNRGPTLVFARIP